MCIVVRHVPSGEYSESMKKALSYEALKQYSLNAEFTETLTKEASEVVSQDIFAARPHFIDPTSILAGIRFTACDFKASGLHQA